ncbi:uncharacterized protein [Musca autumnalis]|uniref:uncharacterized protein n=1 Tax=Musca autumnalis TaxID=221902 RepID=UPI003CEDB80B
MSFNITRMKEKSKGCPPSDDKPKPPSHYLENLGRAFNVEIEKLKQQRDVLLMEMEREKRTKMQTNGCLEQQQFLPNSQNWSEKLVGNFNNSRQQNYVDDGKSVAAMESENWSQKLKENSKKYHNECLDSNGEIWSQVLSANFNKYSKTFRKSTQNYDNSAATKYASGQDQNGEICSQVLSENVNKFSKVPGKSMQNYDDNDSAATKYSSQYQCVSVSPRYATNSDLAMRPKSRTIATQLTTDVRATGDHMMDFEDKEKEMNSIKHPEKVDCTKNDVENFIETHITPKAPQSIIVNCCHRCYFRWTGVINSAMKQPPLCVHKLPKCLNQVLCCGKVYRDLDTIKYTKQGPVLGKPKRDVESCLRRQTTDLNTEHFCARNIEAANKPITKHHNPEIHSQIDCELSSPRQNRNGPSTFKESDTYNRLHERKRVDSDPQEFQPKNIQKSANYSSTETASPRKCSIGSYPVQNQNAANLLRESGTYEQFHGRNKTLSPQKCSVVSSRNFKRNEEISDSHNMREEKPKKHRERVNCEETGIYNSKKDPSAESHNSEENSHTPPKHNKREKCKECEIFGKSPNALASPKQRDLLEAVKRKKPEENVQLDKDKDLRNVIKCQNGRHHDEINSSRVGEESSSNNFKPHYHLREVKLSQTRNDVCDREIHKLRDYVEVKSNTCGEEKDHAEIYKETQNHQLKEKTTSNVVERKVGHNIYQNPKNIVEEKKEQIEIITKAHERDKDTARNHQLKENHSWKHMKRKVLPEFDENSVANNGDSNQKESQKAIINTFMIALDNKKAKKLIAVMERYTNRKMEKFERYYKAKEKNEDHRAGYKHYKLMEHKLVWEKPVRNKSIATEISSPRQEYSLATMEMLKQMRLMEYRAKKGEITGERNDTEEDKDMCQSPDRKSFTKCEEREFEVTNEISSKEEKDQDPCRRPDGNKEKINCYKVKEEICQSPDGGNFAKFKEDETEILSDEINIMAAESQSFYSCHDGQISPSYKGKSPKRFNNEAEQLEKHEITKRDGSTNEKIRNECCNNIGESSSHEELMKLAANRSQGKKPPHEKLRNYRQYVKQYQNQDYPENRDIRKYQLANGRQWSQENGNRDKNGINNDKRDNHKTIHAEDSVTSNGNIVKERKTFTVVGGKTILRENPNSHSILSRECSTDENEKAKQKLLCERETFANVGEGAKERQYTTEDKNKFTMKYDKRAITDVSVKSYVKNREFSIDESEKTEEILLSEGETFANGSEKTISCDRLSKLENRETAVRRSKGKSLIPNTNESSKAHRREENGNSEFLMESNKNGRNKESDSGRNFTTENRESSLRENRGKSFIENIQENSKIYLKEDHSKNTKENNNSKNGVHRESIKESNIVDSEKKTFPVNNGKKGLRDRERTTTTNYTKTEKISNTAEVIQTFKVKEKIIKSIEKYENEAGKTHTNEMSYKSVKSKHVVVDKMNPERPKNSENNSTNEKTDALKADLKERIEKHFKGEDQQQHPGRFERSSREISENRLVNRSDQQGERFKRNSRENLKSSQVFNGNMDPQIQIKELQNCGRESQTGEEYRSTLHKKRFERIQISEEDQSYNCGLKPQIQNEFENKGMKSQTERENRNTYHNGRSEGSSRQFSEKHSEEKDHQRQRFNRNSKVTATSQISESDQGFNCGLERQIKMEIQNKGVESQIEKENTISENDQRLNCGLEPEIQKEFPTKAMPSQREKENRYTLHKWRGQNLYGSIPKEIFKEYYRLEYLDDDFESELNSNTSFQGEEKEEPNTKEDSRRKYTRKDTETVENKQRNNEIPQEVFRSVHPNTTTGSQQTSQEEEESENLFGALKVKLPNTEEDTRKTILRPKAMTTEVYKSSRIYGSIVKPKLKGPQRPLNSQEERNEAFNEPQGKPDDNIYGSIVKSILKGPQGPYQEELEEAYNESQGRSANNTVNNASHTHNSSIEDSKHLKDQLNWKSSAASANTILPGKKYPAGQIVIVERSQAKSSNTLEKELPMTSKLNGDKSRSMVNADITSISTTKDSPNPGEKQLPKQINGNQERIKYQELRGDQERVQYLGEDDIINRKCIKEPDIVEEPSENVYLRENASKGSLLTDKSLETPFISEEMKKASANTYPKGEQIAYVETERISESRAIQDAIQLSQRSEQISSDETKRISESNEFQYAIQSSQQPHLNHNDVADNSHSSPNTMQVLRDLRNFLSSQQIVDTSEGEELGELAIDLIRKISKTCHTKSNPMEMQGFIAEQRVTDNKQEEKREILEERLMESNLSTGNMKQENIIIALKEDTKDSVKEETPNYQPEEIHEENQKNWNNDNDNKLPSFDMEKEIIISGFEEQKNKEDSDKNETQWKGEEETYSFSTGNLNTEQQPKLNTAPTGTLIDSDAVYSKKPNYPISNIDPKQEFKFEDEVPNVPLKYRSVDFNKNNEMDLNIRETELEAESSLEKFQEFNSYPEISTGFQKNTTPLEAVQTPCEEQQEHFQTSSLIGPLKGILKPFTQPFFSGGNRSKNIPQNSGDMAGSNAISDHGDRKYGCRHQASNDHVEIGPIVQQTQKPTQFLARKRDARLPPFTNCPCVLKEYLEIMNNRYNISKT